MRRESRGSWLQFRCQAFGPDLQVSRKGVLHHSCDTAHYIDQSHADLSRRDDDFVRMRAVAKRSIRNGLQTRTFDSVAVFTIELFVANSPPALNYLFW